METTSPAARRLDLREAITSSTDFTTVIVGPEGESKAFAIHTDLLRKACGYFEAAYQSGMIESTTHKFELAEHDPTTWKMMQVWLYGLSLHIPPLPFVDAYTAHMDYYEKCFGLYVHAETLFCPHLQDDLITAMTERMRDTDHGPSLEATSSALKQLPESSHFVAFIARALALTLSNNDFARWAMTRIAFPSRFFQQMMKSRHDMTTMSDSPRMFLACDHHLHAPDDECSGAAVTLLANWGAAERLHDESCLLEDS